MKSDVKLAVILAAGQGLRFGSTGKMLPKGLIEVYGKSLVERSIDTLLSYGMQSIIIVTGHLSDMYVDRLSNVKEIRFVFNGGYAESGSMQSLSLCNSLISEDFVLLDSDIIYEPKILEALLLNEARNSIAISNSTQAGDEVWVQGTDDRVIGLGKIRNDFDHEILGEFTGISKVSRVLLDCMMALNSPERPIVSSEYEEFLTHAAVHVEIKSTHVQDAKWGEIDTPEQLERVLKVFSKSDRENC